VYVEDGEDDLHIMHISHYAILDGDAGYVEDGPHIVAHGCEWFRFVYDFVL